MVLSALDIPFPAARPQGTAENKFLGGTHGCLNFANFGESWDCMRSGKCCVKQAAATGLGGTNISLSLGAGGQGSHHPIQLISLNLLLFLSSLRAARLQLAGRIGMACLGSYSFLSQP